MNIQGLNLNIHSIDAPAGHLQVISMLEEACVQIGFMNECMASVIDECEAASAPL